MQIYEVSFELHTFAALKDKNMDYSDYVYIASCVFTRHFPELSFRIPRKNRRQ